MNHLEKVIEGLKIFVRYGTEYLSSEHDVIYCQSNKSLSEEDETRLRELGFTKDISMGSWFIYV